MKKRTIVKLVSFAGMALGGIGTLLSNWASDKEQRAIIEKKVMEVLSNQKK